MRALALLLFLIQSAPLGAQQTAAESLNHAGQLFQSGDIEGARRALEQTITLAVQQNDRPVQAQARFSLGARLSQEAKYEASDLHFRPALALYEELGNRRKAGESHTFLGQNAYLSGRGAEARGHYEKAMALFELLEDWHAVALMHHSMTYFTGGEEWSEHIQRGLEIARKVGDRKVEAQLLRAWADGAYGVDDFDVAFEHLIQARSILETLRDRPALATVLTSIGRLYRVHGHPDQAFLYYQRARELQKEVGDVSGVIQSIQAMGVALNALGRSSEALRYNQEGLQLARGSGSPLFIKFMLEAVASCRMHLGQNQEAAAALEEARLLQPPRVETFALLSAVRFRLGQFEAALNAADESLAMRHGVGEINRNSLQSRARALWKLGRTQESLADIRKLTESIEQARARLVPTDFMKQGFSETDRDVTSLSIQILLDNGEDREALEAAERSRSRAFLDLLSAKNAARTDPVAKAGEAAPPGVLMRPGASSAERYTLPNRGSASPATAADAIALAARIDSTILAYWVDEGSTVIWTVSPQGRVTHVRTRFGARTLEQWIDGALSQPEKPAAPVPLKIASRSGEVLLAGSQSRAPWRDLYNALILPVRASLPSKPGSRLTIIPSGPLFRLSFAALLDPRGRYLVENYALNYAPAIEAFRYTRQAQERTTGMPARYLLVANPSAMPSFDGKALVPLPGSEKEVQSIARLTPPGSAVLLLGKQADEAGVREAMPAANVIHLATHGIVGTSDPLASFLALGRTGDQPGSNGRLTAEEVYGLNLRADLVVLSACRTGLGRISNDGVAGLARAFFYAGAASVISTLWDVADQPTAQLTKNFYRAFSTRSVRAGKSEALRPGKSEALHAGKSEALRDAQLRLLRALREGEVRVDTPFGALPLPEDPSLWAGYVLLGEPQ